MICARDLLPVTQAHAHRRAALVANDRHLVVIERYHRDLKVLLGCQRLRRHTQGGGGRIGGGVGNLRRHPAARKSPSLDGLEHVVKQRVRRGHVEGHVHAAALHGYGVHRKRLLEHVERPLVELAPVENGDHGHVARIAAGQPADQEVGHVGQALPVPVLCQRHHHDVGPLRCDDIDGRGTVDAVPEFPDGRRGAAKDGETRGP